LSERGKQAHFSRQVDMRRVNLDTLKPWIATTITELLSGVEDEVLINMVLNLLADASPNGRDMFAGLLPFLEGNTAAFLSELWAHLLSAAANAQPGLPGIPQFLLDAKKAELSSRAAAEERASEFAQRLPPPPPLPGPPLPGPPPLPLPPPPPADRAWRDRDERRPRESGRDRDRERERERGDGRRREERRSRSRSRRSRSRSRRKSRRSRSRSRSRSRERGSRRKRERSRSRKDKREKSRKERYSRSASRGRKDKKKKQHKRRSPSRSEGTSEGGSPVRRVEVEREGGEADAVALREAAMASLKPRAEEAAAGGDDEGEAGPPAEGGAAEEEAEEEAP